MMLHIIIRISISISLAGESMHVQRAQHKSPARALVSESHDVTLTAL